RAVGEVRGVAGHGAGTLVDEQVQLVEAVALGPHHGPPERPVGGRVDLYPARPARGAVLLDPGPGSGGPWLPLPSTTSAAGDEARQAGLLERGPAVGIGPRAVHYCFLRLP